ncbi:stomatal closure-related actin-binding protein 1-like [Phragmites australis]|uniref:stomatal closure-related actin-binding protein 1-like n=1 Tax=Phragmites australis TaxID=29695 RepID=UPI002D76801A|nr:stomatal closure-related actin-binding protein 1-like [Phragmites australis]XP_062211370.1 stomatal closure-related actin-binding protein 1-like [Phragmites australis]
MTRAATLDYGGKTQSEALRPGPLRPANIIRNKFPTYKNGSNGIVIKLADGPEMPPVKEIVAKETADLLDRRQRLSVRELAMKFEKGLNTATLLSNEVKWRQVALLERDILLKNLKSVLESLRDRVTGKTKDEIKESISMVEILAVQLSKRETELLQQKAEVTKLAKSLKQASEDAKRIVEEERANAHSEIESARNAVQRVQQAIREHEKMSQSTGKQDMEELKKEVREARRIKMLHHPSKAMDLENEIRVLRKTFAEKSTDCVNLLKELELHKRLKESDAPLFDLEGLQCLGSILHIVALSGTSMDLSNISIQWFRIHPKGSNKEIISGATRSVYALEPHDVGRYVQAEINFNGEIAVAKTVGPVDPDAGLVDYVETLVRKPETEFNVVVLQLNGVDQPKESVHVLDVGRLRMRLTKGKLVVAKEFYSSSMQICGVRGGGEAAPQAIFWRPRDDLSLVLAFETTRERNAAIMLARRFAIDCNIILAGPGDKTPW